MKVLKKYYYKYAVFDNPNARGPSVVPLRSVSMLQCNGLPRMGKTWLWGRRGEVPRILIDFDLLGQLRSVTLVPNPPTISNGA